MRKNILVYILMYIISKIIYIYVYKNRVVYTYDAYDTYTHNHRLINTGIHKYVYYIHG